MQWITRASPKIDRIAAETGATPYDIPGVEMGRRILVVVHLRAA